MLLKFNHRRELTVVSSYLDRLDRARLHLAHKYYLRCDGRDDAEQFNEAFDSLPRNPGGKVTATALQFNIATGLLMPNGASFVGQGPSTVLKRVAESAIHLINNADDSGGNNNLVLADMTLDANAAADALSGYHTVRFKRVDNVWIHHLTVLNSLHHAIQILAIDNDTDTIINNRIWIKDCRIEGSETGSGILVCCAEIVVMEGNNVKTVALDGLQVKTCKRAYFEKNTVIDASRHGIQESANKAVSSSDVFIVNNDLYNSGQYGIYASGGKTQISGGLVDTTVYDGVRVSGNDTVIKGVRVIGARRGILVYTAIGCTVSGNVSSANSQAGIELEDADRNTVTGNTCRDAGGAYPGISLVDSDKNEVSGNTCYGNTRGVDETGTSDYNHIHGNNVRDNDTAGVRRAGANTIVRDNPGSSIDDLIADPGDAGAISVAVSGHVLLVTGGAETRTMAIPSVTGTEIHLSLKTDGGDCVVTVAGPVNVAGNNTLTFDNESEHILLRAIDANGTLEWCVIANDGVGLSTV